MSSSGPNVKEKSKLGPEITKNPKQRGLGLTLKLYVPPPNHPTPPTTLKHEGGVPQKNSKSKKVSVSVKKVQVDSKRKDME